MKKVIITRCFIMTAVVLGATHLCLLISLSMQMGTLETAQIVKLLLPAFLAGIVAALITIPLSSIKISEAITKPIKLIGNRLKLIEQGDYNIILSYPREDEVLPVISAINVLTKDISETMQELTTEKQKAQYILNNMESGLLLVDSNMHIQQYNGAISKYFVIDEDIIGQDVAHLTEDKELHTALSKALTGEVSSVFDMDLMDSAGAILSVRVNPTFGAWAGSSKAVSAIVFFTNVTQAREMENMRSEFVANVSHELKTPITSIKGFAELLTAGVVSDPKAVQEYLCRMKDEADRMTSLIDDILRLASLESSTIVEKHSEVNLRELTDDIIFSLTPQINKKNLSIQVNGTAVMKAYPDDMRQLLKNMIENAVNYNIDGGRLTVSLSTGLNKTKITVSDTGIGIPAEHQPRIFERFYRVDKGRSKREGGTGLGLSIVKHIAAKYHGQITLTSKPDEGTTIKIILPND